MAEGVETTDTWARLVELGCDAAQGYLLARPMAVTAFPAWVASHHQEPAAATAAP